MVAFSGGILYNGVGIQMILFDIYSHPGVAQLVARLLWELKVATRSPLQKSEETREKRRKNEHLPFDLPSQKWFDHNFDQFCENYNFISFFTIEV